ncbi:MAG: polysaccharide deacetylase family protein [Myxococcales bacterium]
MRVALTFDDGPGPATPRLLDVLAARGARATFFLLGQNVARARDVCARAARAGHGLGNHSWSHPKPAAIAEAAFAEEIRRTDALLAEIRREAGLPPLPGPFPVRLPYGPAADDPRLRALAALGRTHVHWTGDFADWKQPEPVELAGRLREHVERQHALGLPAVLDLHDSSRRGDDRSATVEAVRLLLEAADLEIDLVPP